MIVFLGFDGVTHGLGRPAFDPECLALLETVLGEHRAQVVISSSWRYDHLVERLVGKLGPVGRFVIDVTPDDPGYSKTPRLDALLAWLQQAAYTGSWLAIDDKPEWYGELADRVVAPDPRVGFQTVDANAFGRLAKQARGGPEDQPEVTR